MEETMISESETRVERHSDEQSNQRIRRQIEANIIYYAQRLDQIERRLRELDQEWDIERVIETNASILSLIGVTLGLAWRRFNLLGLVVGGFLLQHGLSGWCPPVSVLRRLGVRTHREICQERYALKGLRGDFRDLHPEAPLDPAAKTGKAMQAVEI